MIASPCVTTVFLLHKMPSETLVIVYNGCCIYIPTSQFVHPILHILRPLCRSTAAIESLPRNRLAYGYPECLVHILVHLVHKEKHGDVHFLHIAVGDIGQTVKEIRVLTAEMYRHHVTPVLYTLGDERLLPCHIAYLSATSA